MSSNIGATSINPGNEEDDSRCRLCAMIIGEDSKRINMNEEQVEEIVEGLLDISQVESKRLSCITLVCLRCWNEIQHFKAFVERCRRAQELLLENIFIRECPTPEDDDELVDEGQESKEIDVKESQLLITANDAKPSTRTEKCFEEIERHVNLLLLEIDEKQNKISSATSVHECSDCLAEFLSRDSLLEHRKTCDRNGNDASNRTGILRCTLCDFTSISRAALGFHLLRLHGDSDKLPVSGYIDEDDVVCPICEDSFTNLQELRYHLPSHLQNAAKPSGSKEPVAGSKRCTICSKDFRTWSLYRVHMKYHLNQKDVICEGCGKRFYSKSDMREHYEAVHEHKRYVCNICGIHIKLKSNIRRHLRSHDVTQQFKCDQCPKRFACRTNLRYHLDAHLGRKRYPCEICGEAFQYTYARNQHLFRAHGIQIAGVKIRKERKRRIPTTAESDSKEPKSSSICSAAANVGKIRESVPHTVTYAENDDLIEYAPESPTT
ncbi:zinc finger protein 136-like [Anopheles aquasalis]|uniref:zinc finger protein 136-like n=1 Tax=Anopheles aquasalis TaxID=42839 RepID=UPI00215B3C99|nr:zinc finger protein 136-like [Anopheles aquasalis]